MKYIKLFALIGAVALSAALVSACADKTPPPPPPPAPEAVHPNS